MRMAVIMTMSSPWAKEAVLRFCELGHEVHVFNVSDNPKHKGYLVNHSSLRQSAIESLFESAHIHDIFLPIKSDFRYFLGGYLIHTLCRKHHVEILLTMYGGGYATMAYVSRFRPFVIYAVGSDILFSTGLKEIINRFTHQAAEKIFANGVYLAAKARELIHRGDIESLYLGVDTDHFSPETEKKNDVVILCTRGFIPVYNNNYLIQALALLPEDLPYSEVIFSSTGPDLDRTKSLADRILPSSIRRKIRFLGGVSNDELLYHLRKASIFVSLSRSDGTSISLLEALSCGLFPVLSDIPQNREWIAPAMMNGFLVPLDQPEALAKTLRRAILDHGLRQAAGPINRNMVLKLADGRKNMKILASKLEEIVDKHRTKIA